ANMTAVIDAELTGAAALVKSELGTLVLTGANTYGGATTVQAGTLLVDGDQSAATGLTSVESGATVGGTGIIGGDLTVADGAIVNPGGIGNAAGTLTVNGNLSLSGGAILDYELGAANVVGGPLNDLLQVGGDLT